MRKKVG
jgi:hypothetical protein